MSKQIRVNLDDKTYESLKKESKKYNLSLSKFCELKLNGFTLKSMDCKGN